MTRSLFSVDDLSVDELRALTEPNSALVGVAEATPAYGTLALMFEQPSVRTAASFAVAGVRAGLVPIPITINGDPFRDQCDLYDEVLQLAMLSTCVVVRSERPLDKECLATSAAPLINAGDGTNEHPTQALIDLTALRSFGVVGKRVVQLGNLRDHRVHHSLCLALQKFGVEVALVSPPGMSMPSNYIRRELQTVETSDAERVNEMLADADYIYMTMTTYWNQLCSRHQPAFTIDAHRAKSVLKPNAKILHPFPRTDELAVDVDRTCYNGYHRQTALGPSVRLNLLRWLAARRTTAVSTRRKDHVCVDDSAMWMPRSSSRRDGLC